MLFWPGNLEVRPLDWQAVGGVHIWPYLPGFGD